MQSEKIVVKFPSDVFKIKEILEQDVFKINDVLREDIFKIDEAFGQEILKINGVMESELSTIRCFAPGLDYKDAFGVEQTFTLVCTGVIANALKTLKLHQELSFDSPNAIFYMEKNFSQLSDEVALTALMIASIEKTAAINDAIKFGSGMTASTAKSITGLIDEVSIGTDLRQLVEKCSRVIGDMKISDEIQNIAIEKCMVDVNFCYGIDHVLSATAEKYAGPFISTEQFSSSMKASAVYFRRLRDIDALTFADIDNWTMAIVDMVEI